VVDSFFAFLSYRLVAWLVLVLHMLSILLLPIGPIALLFGISLDIVTLGLGYSYDFSRLVQQVKNILFFFLIRI
jgi:hypothetical protein